MPGFSVGDVWMNLLNAPPVCMLAGSDVCIAQFWSRLVHRLRNRLFGGSGEEVVGAAGAQDHQETFQRGHRSWRDDSRVPYQQCVPVHHPNPSQAHLSIIDWEGISASKRNEVDLVSVPCECARRRLRAAPRLCRCVHVSPGIRHMAHPRLASPRLGPSPAPLPRRRNVWHGYAQFDG